MNHDHIRSEIRGTTVEACSAQMGWPLTELRAMLESLRRRVIQA